MTFFLKSFAADKFPPGLLITRRGSFCCCFQHYKDAMVATHTSCAVRKKYYLHRYLLLKPFTDKGFIL